MTAWILALTASRSAAPRGTGNVIADNGISGILIDGNFDHNSFLSNSIYDNASLGINLGNGPTLNHLDEQGFTLPAPNDYQNYPVLDLGGLPYVDRSDRHLNAAANTTYLMQFSPIRRRPFRIRSGPAVPRQHDGEDRSRL